MAGKEAAQALADKLLGRTEAQSDTSAVDAIVSGVRLANGKHPNRNREPGDMKAENLNKDERVSESEQEEDDDDEELIPTRRERNTPTEEELDNEFDEDEEEDEEDEEEDDDNDGGDEEEDDGPDEEESEQEREDEPEFEEFDYDDDDTIEVVVDGETQEVTLRDLKLAYSGEGAIQKRLKEATELRKAAQAEREQGAQEVAMYRQNLARTIQQLDSVLFTPLIDKPDAKLRQKDMNEYLMQQDAYEADQSRIKEGRAQLSAALQQEYQKDQQARFNRRKAEERLLVQAMPELKDDKKAQQVQKDIQTAAKHYGFTAEQVAMADDHRLFLMARDAGRLINMLTSKNKTSRTPTGGEQQKRRRKLMKGGTSQSLTARKVQSKKAAKENAALEDKARKTGSVDDVANMLVAAATSKQKGLRNGRRGTNR